MKVINAVTENSYEYIKEFGEFIDADCIEYKDFGNGEDYIITKNNKVMIINVRGNKYDGGFAHFSKC